ncbi:zinc finger protein 709-like [Elysia marginata]|uniref:Zinc finger protein 709-like n=1 Tax=Elysia marginata TaxID=1093978 RepID=A0AAV4FXZ7_9GAST|nr:zinc finger protein 709-like [Elysia marginata]
MPYLHPAHRRPTAALQFPLHISDSGQSTCTTFKAAMETPMKPLPASNGPRPHRCEVCQRSFREIATLRKHEQLHRADRPYVCTTCGKSFLWSSNLKVHERVHTGERPYKCKICHRCFTQSNDLRRHERNVHMRGKLYGYKTGRHAAQADSQQVNLAAYQAFAMQQRALLQQALTYESYLQKAAAGGVAGGGGAAAAAAQLFHHTQQAAMGGAGPPRPPDGGPPPHPASSSSPRRSPLKLEQVTPPATPSDMEGNLSHEKRALGGHNSSPHDREMGLHSPGRGGALTSMPLVSVIHSPPALLPSHYSAMKSEGGLDLVSRAGSLPSFSSFRPMHRPLDGIQAMSMGAMGPRGPPHHPHLPPSTTSGSSAEGALRVSPHHPHLPAPSHLSPVGSEGGPGVLLSPHGGQPHLNHHHHLPHHHPHHDQHQQQHHPDPRLTQDMINFHHHQQQQQQQQHHSNVNGSGSSSDLNCSVSTSSGLPNGPGVSLRQLSPSSRRSLSPADAERRRETKNGDMMDVEDERRTSEGGDDSEGRKSRERRQSMGSDYNRNGDISTEDGEVHPHLHRNGPGRSSSRDGYMGMRSPEHGGGGSLERSLSSQLDREHPDQLQRHYQRSRSVSPDYRHHHHRHLDHHLLHQARSLEEEHLRKMAGSSSYPCDSVMDLSMSKPPALTSASPPSRSSSTASSSHVVDKEVAGVTTNSSSINNNNNNNNSSASAAAMPPPKTPTSAATTPTALPNGGLGGLLGLGSDGRRRTASSSEFGESESEPGKRDVTTTSATPTNSGADSSIHHCHHCNIFFHDYTMFHLHESLHMPYEDHPFRCPSCGTHCQDKIEFMFHTVWHVKYPHTIPNYTPFREGFLASSSSP